MSFAGVGPGLGLSVPPIYSDAQISPQMDASLLQMRETGSEGVVTDPGTLSYICVYPFVYTVLPKLEANVSESKFESTGLRSCPQQAEAQGR